jgi:hypothetical protein
MSHSEHRNEDGELIPSVSAIPAIFAKDMDGFEDYICSKLHARGDKCCTKAKRQFYSEAADLGNDIHNLREAFLRGEGFTEGVPEYQASVFDPVARFYKESGYEPLEMPYVENTPNFAIELKMTGKSFGGTLDGAGTFSVPFWEKQRKTFWQDGIFEDMPTTESIWIEDLKVKSKLDPLHPLQLYGYSLLLKELYGIEAKYGLIIRREKNLTKQPEIQLRAYYLPSYKKQWNASLLMWKFLND